MGRGGGKGGRQGKRKGSQARGVLPAPHPISLPYLPLSLFPSIPHPVFPVFPFLKPSSLHGEKRRVAPSYEHPSLTYLPRLSPPPPPPLPLRPTLPPFLPQASLPPASSPNKTPPPPLSLPTPPPSHKPPCFPRSLPSNGPLSPFPDPSLLALSHPLLPPLYPSVPHSLRSSHKPPYLPPPPQTRPPPPPIFLSLSLSPPPPSHKPTSFPRSLPSNGPLSSFPDPSLLALCTTAEWPNLADGNWKGGREGGRRGAHARGEGRVVLMRKRRWKKAMQKQ